MRGGVQFPYISGVYPIQPTGVAGLTHWHKADGSVWTNGETNPSVVTQPAEFGGGSYVIGDFVEYSVFYSGAGSPERYSDRVDLTSITIGNDAVGVLMEFNAPGSTILLRRRLNLGGYTWLATSGLAFVDNGTGWSSTMPYFWLGNNAVNNDTVRAMSNHAATFTGFTYADAIMAEVGARATFKTGIQNGLPGLLFTTSQVMDTLAFAGQSVGTEFVVVKQNDTLAGEFVVDGTGRQTIFGHNGYNPTQWARFQGGVGSPAFGIITTSAAILAVTFTGDATAMGYLNGVAGFSGTAGSGSCTTRRLGQADGGGGGFNGYIFEHIRYNAVLTDTQRKGVTKYLSNKWGIAVTQ